jgi:hypothetical protein
MTGTFESMIDCKIGVKISNTCTQYNECFTTNHSLGLVSSVKFHSFDDALIKHEGIKYQKLYTAIVDGKLILSFDREGKTLVPNGHITKQRLESGEYVYRYLLTTDKGALIKAVTLSKMVLTTLKHTHCCNNQLPATRQECCKHDCKCGGKKCNSSCGCSTANKGDGSYNSNSNVGSTQDRSSTQIGASLSQGNYYEFVNTNREIMFPIHCNYIEIAPVGNSCCFILLLGQGFSGNPIKVRAGRMNSYSFTDRVISGIRFLNVAVGVSGGFDVNAMYE